jgi:adenylate cyclase
VSEGTFRKLKGTYRSREADLVVVKGKTQPVAVYEILDYHSEHTFTNIVSVLSFFRDGLAKYRQKKWDQAIDLFNQALALNAEDKLSKLYLHRCEMLKASPPPEDWDGVWVMESK